MAKKKKEQESVVFRVTIALGNEMRDYLVTADYYELQVEKDEIVDFYKFSRNTVATFRNWIAIENLKEAEAWGERFEKLAKPVQCDLFEPTSS